MTYFSTNYTSRIQLSSFAGYISNFQIVEKKGTRENLGFVYATLQALPFNALMCCTVQHVTTCGTTQ